MKHRSLPRRLGPIDNNRLDERKILILSKQGLGDESTIKSQLKQDCGLNAEFFTDPKSTTLHLERCKYFLHDWDSFENAVNHRLHQRIASMENLEHLCRMICSEQGTAELKNLADELHIPRVMTKAAFIVNAANEISAASAVHEQAHPLLKQLIAIQNGSIAYSQEQIDRTVKECFACLPQDITAKIEFANLCYRQGDFDRAEQLAVEVIHNCPDNVRALMLLARLATQRGDFRKATKLLERADAINPESPRRLIFLGDSYLQQKQLENARQAFQKAVIADPCDHKPAIALTQFEFASGNEDKAVEFFQQSLSEEEIASTFNGIGIVAVKDERHREAIRFYEIAEAALKTDRYRHMICFNLALAYKYQRDFEKALLYLNTALKLKPDYDKALRQKAIVIKLMDGNVG